MNAVSRHKNEYDHEVTCLAAFAPPIEIIKPSQLLSPLIFASPHSGRIYPQSFAQLSTLTETKLRKNEDAFIDKLFSPVANYGAPLLVAHFPRCFVDVNRSPEELPSEWGKKDTPLSARTQAGYGVIPLAVEENMPIYRNTPSAQIVQPRLNQLYYPYHKALQDLILAAQNKFGHALIVDCHSMPGFAPMGARRADIVLGDRYGTSCYPETISRFETAFREENYSVTRNYPYAGGYVTEHYGQPDQNIEVIQIEINRDLYLNPITIRPNRRYKIFEEKLETIIGRIISSHSKSKTFQNSL